VVLSRSQLSRTVFVNKTSDTQETTFFKERTRRDERCNKTKQNEAGRRRRRRRRLSLSVLLSVLYTNELINYYYYAFNNEQRD
jgi:hypothetical protein